MPIETVEFAHVTLFLHNLNAHHW